MIIVVFFFSLKLKLPELYYLFVNSIDNMFFVKVFNEFLVTLVNYSQKILCIKINSFMRVHLIHTNLKRLPVQYREQFL